MAVEWTPLELWRAGDLEDETRRVVTLYEEALASGDGERMASLRASIERRMDDLENFFVAHAEEDRAVLFEAQRLRLRSLLQARAPGAGAPTPSAAAGAGEGEAGGSGVVPSAAKDTARAVGPNTRLSKEEVLAWLARSGRREMPGLRPEHASLALDELVADAADERVAIKDLRRWYFAVYRKGKWQPKSKDDLGRSGGSAGAATGRSSKAPIYSWELTEEAGAGVATMTTSHEPPLGMPAATLDFQVRLSEEEYAALCLRRRRLEAEKRYRERVARAHRERQAKMERGAADVAPKDVILMSGPYVEPAQLNSYIYRSPQPRRWITKDGFDARASQ